MNGLGTRVSMQTIGIPGLISLCKVVAGQVARQALPGQTCPTVGRDLGKRANTDIGTDILWAVPIEFGIILIWTVGPRSPPRTYFTRSARTPIRRRNTAPSSLKKQGPSNSNRQHWITCTTMSSGYRRMRPTLLSTLPASPLLCTSAQSTDGNLTVDAALKKRGLHVRASMEPQNAPVSLLDLRLPKGGGTNMSSILKVFCKS